MSKFENELITSDTIWDVAAQSRFYYSKKKRSIWMQNCSSPSLNSNFLPSWKTLADDFCLHSLEEWLHMWHHLFVLSLEFFSLNVLRYFSSFDIIFLYFYKHIFFCPVGTHQYSLKIPKKIIKIERFWNSDIESGIQDTTISMQF